MPSIFIIILGCVVGIIIGGFLDTVLQQPIDGVKNALLSLASAAAAFFYVKTKNYKN